MIARVLTPEISPSATPGTDGLLLSHALVGMVEQAGSYCERRGVPPEVLVSINKIDEPGKLAIGRIIAVPGDKLGRVVTVHRRSDGKLAEVANGTEVPSADERWKLVLYVRSLRTGPAPSPTSAPSS